MIKQLLLWAPSGRPDHLSSSLSTAWVPCCQELKAQKEALQHYDLCLFWLVYVPIKYFENHPCMPWISQFNSKIILTFWEKRLRLKEVGDLIRVTVYKCLSTDSDTSLLLVTLKGQVCGEDCGTQDWIF